MGGLFFAELLKRIEKWDDCEEIKDRNGRVDPSIAVDMVIDTIESCETEEHLRGAKRLVENLCRLYADREIDDARAELTESLVEKAKELNVDLNKDA